MIYLREEICTVLGDPTIVVELTDEMLNTCVTRAVRMLNHYHPPSNWSTIQYAHGQPMYVLTDPGIHGVIDVQAARRWPSGGFFLFPWAYPGMMLSYAPLVAPGDTNSDLMQQMQYNKATQQVMGKEFDWEQRRDRFTKQISLFVRAEPGAKVMYEYVWHLTPDDDPLTGIGNCPPSDLDWLARYSTALAKQILSRILRKFGGGVNMPDGSTEQLDGESLMEEGKQVKRRI